MTRAAAVRCRLHPAAIAGWRCEQCKRYLCGECTAWSFTQFHCVECDTPVAQLSVARREKNLVRWLADAIIHPLRHPFQTVLVALLVFGLASVERLIDSAASEGDAPMTPELAEAQKNLEEGRKFLEADSPELDIREAQRARAEAAARAQEETPTVIAVARSARIAILVAFAIAIIGATANRPRAARLVGLIAQLARTAIALAIVAAPAAVYFRYVHGAPGEPALQDDPMAWLILGAGLPYVAIAFAAGPTQRTAGELLSPFAMWQWGWRLGVQFWVTALGVGGIGYLLTRVHQLPLLPGRPLVEQLLQTIMFVALVAIAARLLGLLTYVRGDVFGWGDPAMYRDPLFPRLKAEGRRKTAPAPGPEAGGEAAGAAPSGGRDPNEGRIARQVVECVRDDNLARALKLYESRPTWGPGALDDRELLALGRAAEQARKRELARALYTKVVEAAGARAPRAMFLLAKVQDERTRTLEIYREILDKFPGTDVAKQAEKLLAEAAVDPGPASG